jgi:hypothetical protein
MAITYGVARKDVFCGSFYPPVLFLQHSYYSILLVVIRQVNKDKVIRREKNLGIGRLENFVSFA